MNVQLIRAYIDAYGNRKLTFSKNGRKASVQTASQLPVTTCLLMGCRGLGDLTAAEYARCVEEVQNTRIIVGVRTERYGKFKGEKIFRIL